MWQELIISLLILVVIWLGIVTFYLRRLMQHYQILTRGVNKKNLEFVLENLTKDMSEAKKNIFNLISRCDTIEKNETYHQNNYFVYGGISHCRVCLNRICHGGGRVPGDL